MMGLQTIQEARVRMDGVQMSKGKPKPPPIEVVPKSDIKETKMKIGRAHV